MRHHLRVLGFIFSVVLNVAFLGSYVYRTVMSRAAFAYEEINLDAAQRTRMVSSRDRFIEAVDRIGNSIVDLHVELIDAVATEPTDRRAVDVAIDKIRSQQQSMQQGVVAHLLEDKSILNPGQRKAFFDILKRRIRSQSFPGPPWLPRDRR
jgi:Spy/CpxP family protein refolding chaperone